MPKFCHGVKANGDLETLAWLEFSMYYRFLQAKC